MKVTIIDYGMGNIWSVASALKNLNCRVEVSSDPRVVEKSSNLILPGVGSFARAMVSLKNLKLDQAILLSIQRENNKILGICLGMQLLGVESSEDEITSGINLIPELVDRFSNIEAGLRKIPHIGFDQVFTHPDSILLKNLPMNPDFYFVHSYRMLKTQKLGKSSYCNYGVEFIAAYEHNNIFATQFHPEKSQTNGLSLLRNFLMA